MQVPEETRGAPSTLAGPDLAALASWPAPPGAGGGGAPESPVPNSMNSEKRKGTPAEVEAGREQVRITAHRAHTRRGPRACSPGPPEERPRGAPALGRAGELAEPKPHPGAHLGSFPAQRSAPAPLAQPASRRSLTSPF